MSRAALVAVLAVLLAACAGTGSAPAAPSPVTPAPAPAPRPGTFAVPPGATIVIDPGHNGGNARAAAAPSAWTEITAAARSRAPARPRTSTHGPTPASSGRVRTTR